jgi:hypothetical protein
MIAALILALCAQAPAQKPLDREMARNIGLLKSADRLERYSAATALMKSRSLPESAGDPIVDYIKLQVQEAMVVPVFNKPHRDTTIEKIPVLGDEASIGAIRANPDRFIGKSFILIGGIKASDAYRHGFRDAAGTHYSFDFGEIGSDGSSFLGSNTIYALKFGGAALAEMAVKTEQTQGGALLGVRLRCTIRPERIDHGELKYATDAIEATDWQTLAPDKKTWLPWTFESIAVGYQLLFRAGRSSVDKCLDLIMDEGTFQDEKADTMLKGSAIAYLLGLPSKDRKAILRRVQTRAKRTRSAVARRWGQRASESLVANQLAF